MIVKNRIKKHSEFQKVIAEGELRRTDSFMFYTNPNALGYTRIGISVPKKSGNAVIRNKIKRQVRACFAKINNYSTSNDIVVIVRKNYDINNFVKTESEILTLFTK